MVRNIVKDINLLNKKAQPATKDDLEIVKDLMDTLKANENNCIGMAANMIGYNKAIICVSLGFINMPMINPVITKKKRKYKTKESCLSLLGERECERHEEIEVDYYDLSFTKRHGTYQGLVAEIIEHEVDHLNGIII